MIPFCPLKRRICVWSIATTDVVTHCLLLVVLCSSNSCLVFLHVHTQSNALQVDVPELAGPGVLDVHHVPWQLDDVHERRRVRRRQWLLLRRWRPRAALHRAPAGHTLSSPITFAFTRHFLLLRQCFHSRIVLVVWFSHRLTSSSPIPQLATTTTRRAFGCFAVSTSIRVSQHARESAN